MIVGGCDLIDHQFAVTSLAVFFGLFFCWSDWRSSEKETVADTEIKVLKLSRIFSNNKSTKGKTTKKKFIILHFSKCDSRVLGHREKSHKIARTWNSHNINNLKINVWFILNFIPSVSAKCNFSVGSIIIGLSGKIRFRARKWFCR